MVVGAGSCTGGLSASALLRCPQDLCHLVTPFTWSDGMGWDGPGSPDKWTWHAPGCEEEWTCDGEDWAGSGGGTEGALASKHKEISPWSVSAPKQRLRAVHSRSEVQKR